MLPPPKGSVLGKTNSMVPHVLTKKPLEVKSHVPKLDKKVSEKLPVKAK